ncbi:MAG: hypothetical protein KDA69_12220 [Planctomycetaceae bacterium]|nr:hypothetical protein [Planctomycetaceae bacterium]
MSYAKQIVELVTLENLGECPLLRHGQAVDIALKADTEIAALKARVLALSAWIEHQGEISNVCTREILGKVCAYCECKHSAKRALPGSEEP